MINKVLTATLLILATAFLAGFLSNKLSYDDLDWENIFKDFW